MAVRNWIYYATDYWHHETRSPEERKSPYTTGGDNAGRKKALSPAAIVALKVRAAAGEAKAKLALEAGISRDTLYEYLREAD